MDTTVAEMITVPDIAGSSLDEISSDEMLAISEMSERFDVTLRTLRFYEEKGLLNPIRKGSRRFYGVRDISRMQVILQAKRIGLTLAEIRRVIKLVESKIARATQYQELLDMCESQQEILSEQKKMLDEQIEEVEQVIAAFSQLLSK